MKHKMLIIQITLAIQYLTLPSYMGTFVKQPYGPRMCESLCAAIYGCDSMVFMTHDLSCRQLQNKDIEKTLAKQESAHVLHLPQTPTVSNITGICKLSSRLIKTRSNELHCLGHNVTDTRGKHCQSLSKECIKTICILLPYSQVINLADPKGQVLANDKREHSKSPPLYEFLQGGGCNTSEVAVENDNLLHLASVGGSSEVMLYLLDKNLYNINGAGLKGRTPAMMAAYCGNKRILELLADRKCNMSVVDDDTFNVLHLAVSRGHLDIVQYVLSLGVDKESRIIETGQTPIILASMQWEYKYILEFLVEYGCDIAAVDNKNNNALNWAALRHSASNIEYLLSLGVDIAHVNSDGNTALMIAAAFGCKHCMEMLVNNGSDPKFAGKISKKNVLHFAAQRKRYDILEYVLTLGIDIESKTSKGLTALLLAAKGSTMNMTKLMIVSGANLTALDNDGCGVMFHAASGGDVDIVNYLKSQGIAVTGSTCDPSTDR